MKKKHRQRNYDTYEKEKASQYGALKAEHGRSYTWGISIYVARKEGQYGAVYVARVKPHISYRAPYCSSCCIQKQGKRV